MSPNTEGSRKFFLTSCEPNLEGGNFYMYIFFLLQHPLTYLAKAGVAISVWTAIDVGTPLQWMLPSVSFKAILNLNEECNIWMKWPKLSDLKSSPMPPYSTGLLTPSNPALPSFLNTWNKQKNATMKLFCGHLMCMVHAIRLPLVHKGIDVLEDILEHNRL